MITNSSDIGLTYYIGMVIQSMMNLTIVRLYIISRLKDGNKWYMARPSAISAGVVDLYALKEEIVLDSRYSVITAHTIGLPTGSIRRIYVSSVALCQYTHAS
jgi:hypothetical protein